MKKFLIVILLISTTALNAQETPTGMDKIKPLDSLINMALRNAPSVHRLTTGQLQKEEEMAMSKKDWLQHVALTAGYNYGNGVISDQLLTSSDNQNTFVTRQNATYSLGLSIRLPFSELVSRKNKIKLNKYAIEEIEYQKSDIKKVIAEEVTKRYNQLSLSFKIIELQTEKMQANESALMLTEGYFKAGKAEMDAYRMALDIATTSKIELEKTKSDAWYTLKTLEQLVGSPIIR